MNAISRFFWSIMADEALTKEQVSVCIRYVRRNTLHKLEVCEEFLGFCSVPITNAEAINIGYCWLGKEC